MTALDFFMAGRFDEAIKAFSQLIASEPEDIAWVDGLAKSYCTIGDFVAAIPLLTQVDAYQRKNNPDAPGQQLQISVAHWCLEYREKAIQLARNLCTGILDQSISMAPDQAGGATFGLILHYMAVTAGDKGNCDYALDYLRSLNVKYDKRPTLFSYPVETVKQVLGELRFEDALEGATKQRSLPAAFKVAKPRQLALRWLGIALFHDGTIRRASDDEIGCIERMKQVHGLGYQTEAIRWQLARHEVARK